MSVLKDAAEAVQGAAQGAMMAATQTVARHAPDGWLPGGKPDPLIRAKAGHVGASVSRIDGPLKVKGGARFAAEFDFDRLTYAAPVFSTISRGRIASLAVAAAEAAPGVVLVMTHHNAPRMQPTPVFMSAPLAAGADCWAVMQGDRVYWNGQPIALVLAETQEQADHAAALIEASYDAEDATLTEDASRAEGTEQGLFMGEPLKVEIGDAEAELAAAAHKTDETYRTPRHSHNPIELHAATVTWDGDTLRVHDASQAVTHTAWSLSHIFGIEQAQVRVTSPYVGGGFGSKMLWSHQVLAAAASKLAGRPVRIMLSREAVFRMVGGRAQTEQRVAIGADAEGRFTAIVHEGFTTMPPHGTFTEPFINSSKGAYAAGSFKLGVQVGRLDGIANTFMRAPGETPGTFALESAVDELAERIGIDPVELRILNEPEQNPTEGTPFSSRNTVKAWRDGAARFGWDQRGAVGARRDGEWLIGLGCAQGTYPYARMPGGAARITLSADGRAVVAIAAHEMGMGTATAHGQVAAERLGLPLDQVEVAYGDSSLPGAVLAGGSQQTAAIGAAVFAAQQKLNGELLKLAGNDSPLAGLSAEEVEGRDGGLGKIDEPGAHETYVSILARARRDQLEVEAEAPPPLEAMHWSMHSWSAVFCEVRVNAVTGETRVTRVLGSYDTGRILNPKTATSQFRGGIIMGLGMALMEETQFDERNGRVMSASLADYHVPAHMDVPEIDVIWTDIPDPHAPMGARGIGEIGITGVAAAVANAVYNATGVRVRELPITLDKLI